MEKERVEVSKTQMHFEKFQMNKMNKINEKGIECMWRQKNGIAEK